MNELPTPNFSKHNPYWIPVTFIGVRAELQPRLTWQDFLYASMWEMQAFDNHGAYCIRTEAAKVASYGVRYGNQFWMYPSVKTKIKELLNEESQAVSRISPGIRADLQCDAAAGQVAVAESAV